MSTTKAVPVRATRDRRVAWVFPERTNPYEGSTTLPLAELRKIVAEAADFSDKSRVVLGISGGWTSPSHLSSVTIIEDL